MWPFIFANVVDAFMYLIHGFVTKTLWNWFMVPLFGLPALGIATAVGLTLVIARFRGGSSLSKKKEESWSEFFARHIANVLGDAVMSLATGWVVLHFVK